MNKLRVLNRDQGKTRLEYVTDTFTSAVNLFEETTYTDIADKARSTWGVVADGNWVNEGSGVITCECELE